MANPASLFTLPAGKLPATLAKSQMLQHFDRTDWQASPLGPLDSWPLALKMAVRVIFGSQTPMALLVGPDGILIYNDGYIPIAGRRHPACFGVSALTSWPEIVDFNTAVIDSVANGESPSYEDQKLTVHRNGIAEEVWFDLDYSPVIDEDGKIIAALALIVETTKLVATERQLAKSREQLSLALGTSAIVGTWDWHVLEDMVYSDAKFAQLYGVDPEIAMNGAPISEFMAAMHQDDIESVGSAMTAAMASGAKFSKEYRLVQKDGSLRWVLAEGQPLLDAAGACIRFPGVTVDISEQKEAMEAHIRSETGFRTLANAMPQMVWATQPDGFHDYYNARWYEFTGVPEGTTDGAAWNGMFHEEDRERAWAQWQHCLATGDPYQIEYRLRHHSGDYRWVLGRALPIRDEKGEITRWYGTCTDIHDARQVQAEREIVAHELSHRIKNIFSVLSGIISLSARSAPESRAFAERLRKRIDAMGRAHDFVRPHSKTSRPVDIETTIFGLAQRLLEPYSLDGTDNRIAFDGENAMIGDSAATPLALLLHELATNSAKYGALSHAAGRLAITGHRDGDLYVLDWKESGSPAQIGEPAQEGFGSRLMKISVEGQLGGQFQRHWNADGMCARITVPLAAISRSSRLSTAQH